MDIQFLQEYGDKVIVAVDYGEKKCGVAFGEILPQKSLVIPTKNLNGFIKKLKPDRIIFGLPLSMSGRYTQQTFKTVAVAFKFSKEYETYLCDERLTTKIGERISKRDDAVSAALIFQSFSENPSACEKITDPRRKVNLTLEKTDGEVLLYEFPDPSLDIEAREVDVVTKNPVLAYFYSKKGYFVERELREKKYDLIVSGRNCSELKKYLKENGRLVCL
ncbi:RuvX/YqgF family protein [Thermotoga sp. Mc24]|uniref:RuvX/YqgF family protein n=1 Tax=Thermotoga sp. Mc24 TaxID=1231241 RepID=UPI0012DFF2FB|nr:RuvX/YqgF family protein [Thermotoga sp. Mc24]